MANSTDRRRQDNLSAEQRREIGRKGGQAEHPRGRGLQNADDKTRQAVARKGGEASRGGGRNG